MRPIPLAPNRVRRFYRGGAAIARLRGIADDGDYAPEDWVGSTTAVFGSDVEGMTRLAGGDLLRDAISADPVGYLGPDQVLARGADPALLVKLLHAGERLPVHCHPDDAFARSQLGAACGKTEAWVIADAEGGTGEVFLGFREAVPEAVLAGWVERQDTDRLLDALNRMPVAPGDAVLVPAGVPHAIGAGILLVELQQPSDLSLLLEWEAFAIDGATDGHLGLGYERALSCVDRTCWDGTRLQATRVRVPPDGDDPAVQRLLPLAADPFFRAERIRPAGGMVRLDPAFSILVILSGSGRLELDTDRTGPLPLTRGDTVLLPHGAGPARLSGPLHAIRCLPPAQPGSPPPPGPDHWTQARSQRGMPIQSPELSTRDAQAGQPRRNASEPLLVGIDLGTTTCKAVVVSAGGAELAHGAMPTPWRAVPSGAETDPRALVDAALGAAERALARTPDGPVLAVGVTGMAETCALLGADGEPVAPAIAWHDLRGQDEAAALASELGADRFAIRVGLPASALCTLAKYRWLRRHLPPALQGTRLLSVAEWVVHRLGGEQLAELSLASRTGALDRDAGDWWDEALAWAEAPAGLLPPVAPAGTPAGKASRRGGRLDGAVLTVAGHDHLCAAVGAGAAAPGELFDSCGTAEALVRAVPPPVEADRVRTALAGHVTVGWHVVPGLQALLGAQRAGMVLQRFLHLLGVAPERVEELEAAGVATPPGADGLTIEQAETDRAVLRGIGRHPSPGLLWRAAAEAVTARSAELIATIERVAGPAARVAAAGGWSRSPTLRAVKAERLGQLDYPPVVEAGARGAALVAGCAAGLYREMAAVPRPGGITALDERDAG